MKLKAPFPYFGGKSRIAHLVWERFGDVKNYVEPFFGSGAVLLARPHWPFGERRYETVNDADGMLANFWRAVKAAPDEVAAWADWPVNEADLHARHVWLVNRKESVTERLMGDPDWYDAKVAGWWVWGASCWVGSSWCTGNGPWNTDGEKLVKVEGVGVHKTRPQMGPPRSLHSKPPGGQVEWLRQLSERLRNVMVCCGDWSRVCGPTPTYLTGTPCGVFLDPPYSEKATRTEGLYGTDSMSVADATREWAIELGKRDDMRIALCGYEGEHNMPDDWECVAWKANGGLANQGNKQGRINKHRERIWFSPACYRQADSLL